MIDAATVFDNKLREADSRAYWRAWRAYSRAYMRVYSRAYWQARERFNF